MTTPAVCYIVVCAVVCATAVVESVISLVLECLAGVVRMLGEGGRLVLVGWPNGQGVRGFPRMLMLHISWFGEFSCKAWIAVIVLRLWFCESW